MIKIKLSWLVFVLSPLFLSNLAYPHHSFAVHFIADETVTVTGTVTAFSFSNPHGLVKFTVIGDNGEQQLWQAETNSPSLLRRRGWSRDSIEVGDEVTIIGYPTRDGTPYVRINLLTFADGSQLIGQGGLLANPNDQD